MRSEARRTPTLSTPSPSQSPTTGVSVGMPNPTEIGPAGPLIWNVAVARSKTASSAMPSPTKLPAIGTSGQFCDCGVLPKAKAAPWNHGSTVLPLRRSSKCRCGPVALPVSPRSPTRLPWSTVWPMPTFTVWRCPYSVDSPLPWSTTTYRP